MTFLDESSPWTKPEIDHTNQTWNANQMNGSIQFISSKESTPYTMCYEGDVHCGIKYWWGYTAPRCTSKTDGKFCLLLHANAATPPSSAQEKTTTIDGWELNDFSWQCKNSYRWCCHGLLAKLAMGDSGTATVLTGYESMRLRSLRESERITARDPIQHKRWTYPCYRSVNTEHQQRWKRWWCTTPSKPLAKVINKGNYCIGGM